MKHQVLRPFEADGRRLQAGEIIDTTHWRPRNLEVQVRRRYLKEVLTAPLEESLGKASKGGRP